MDQWSEWFWYLVYRSPFIIAIFLLGLVVYRKMTPKARKKSDKQEPSPEPKKEEKKSEKKDDANKDEKKGGWFGWLKKIPWKAIGIILVVIVLFSMASQCAKDIHFATRPVVIRQDSGASKKPAPDATESAAHRCEREMPKQILTFNLDHASARFRITPGCRVMYYYRGIGEPLPPYVDRTCWGRSGAIRDCDTGYQAEIQFTLNDPQPPDDEPIWVWQEPMEATP